jgi:hypothetical protein
MIKLPELWNIHPTFNISLLERYRGTDPKRQEVEITADNARWKMESISNSGQSEDDPSKHAYLVEWDGYSHDENVGNA